MFNQASIGPVSRAALGDGPERVWVFSSTSMLYLVEMETETGLENVTIMICVEDRMH